MSMTERRTIKEIIGKTISKICKMKETADYVEIHFSDGSYILIENQSLFDEDGMYFDISEVE